MSAKIGESLENSWDRFTRDLKTEINEIGRLSCFSKLKKEIGGPNSEAYASSSCPGSCVEGCPGCGLRGQMASQVRTPRGGWPRVRSQPHGGLEPHVL